MLFKQCTIFYLIKVRLINIILKVIDQKILLFFDFSILVFLVDLGHLDQF